MQVLDIESSYFRPYVDMFEIREKFSENVLISLKLEKSSEWLSIPLNTVSVSVVGGSSVFLFGSFLLKYLASFYVLV